MNTAAAARPANDNTTWALIAVVACVVAVALGWGIARANSASWGDVQRDTAFAAQNGQLAGQQRGYNEGVAKGRRNAKLQGQVATAAARRTQQAAGYQTGYVAGRQRAIAKAGEAALLDPASLMDPTPMAPGLGTGGAYPVESFQDVLAGTELGSDASGFDGTAGSSTFGTGPSSSAPASTLSDWYRGGSSPYTGG